MTDWKDTTLWKHLEAASGAEAEAARALLVQEMPRIQAILTQAHTAPTDFTLHDADHSFRVAKWMAEIIPGDVLEKLSPYEIALLLLAAYLHDIGMTPEQGRVDRFWSHLVYGAPNPKSPRQPLTEEEAHDLQRWLDDEGHEITVPLAPEGAASEETKRHADLLIAHYCRHKHNDWSGEWIKAHQRRETLPGYEAWVDDLVQLCRSHHESYDELKQSRFDPRPAGSSGRPVHHRYLACVLRVADVLEIDPERTPEVIFRHREIHPGSVLYWRKDHENWLIRDGNSLVFAAYPETAVIENAIRKTADGIRQELATCARLNREQPFFHWQLRPNQQLPHRWDFPEVLTVHVQPRNDAYVYIDGAFRPNTEKLLDLLSGTQLYGDPLVAVRELLQNAFDAVKEEMAYQRLERPKDPEFAKHLAAMHRVELRLEERDGRQWLLCRDTGVGMTRRIIENYVLVSGNSRRREIAELERRCREAGFRLGRTGQFGIGVLSYFMLADRVEIRTRRSDIRTDAEATGWSFVTEGVGSFGELKKEPSAAPGTEVRLRLREELNRKESFEFGTELEKYIESTVRYIPCNMELVGLGGIRQANLWKAGWVHSLEEIANFILPETWVLSTDPLPSAKREKVEVARHWWKAAREALRWSLEEGELPNNLGAYRSSVPCFELPGGRCEAFLFIQSEGQRRVINHLDRGGGIIPKVEGIESIHGMALAGSREMILAGRREATFQDMGAFGFCEVNWESPEAGHLRVDRGSLETSSIAHEAKRWLVNRTREMLAESLRKEPSEYIYLSGRWLGDRMLEPRWTLAPYGATKSLWRSVSFPVVSVADAINAMDGSYSFRGKALERTSKLSLISGPHTTTFFYPPFTLKSPDRVVVRSPRSSSFDVIRLWERIPESDREFPLGLATQLPPEWRKVCGVSFENWGTLVWNRDHPIVVQVDEDSAKWLKIIQGVRRKRLDLLALREDIFVNAGRVSGAFASLLMDHEILDIWTAFVEREPSLAERLFQVALGLGEAVGKERRLGLLKQSYNRWSLIVLAPASGTTANPGDPLFEEFLPDPGPDWTITEAPSDDEPT